MTNRIRAYCFTLNNYTDDEIRLIQDGDYSYIIYGKEIGESGTPHLQGFVHFENAKTMSAIHKLKGWKRTALSESMCPIKAIEYCKKGEQPHSEWERDGTAGSKYGLNSDVWERGSFKQGARTDIANVYDKVKNGMSVDDVAWENPSTYELCFRGLEKLEDIRLRKTFRKEMTQGTWFYGKTGCGKSEYVFDNFDINKAYSYPYDNGWWDGYKQQEIVIIDEFRGQIAFNELLRMVDKHPNYCVRRRCREPMPFNSKQVLITSSMSPQEVFNKLSKNDSLSQLYRRFKIYEIIDGIHILRDESYFDNLLDVE